MNRFEAFMSRVYRITCLDDWEFLGSALFVQAGAWASTLYRKRNEYLTWKEEISLMATQLRWEGLVKWSVRGTT